MRRLLFLTTVAVSLCLAAPAGAQTLQLVPYGGQNFTSPFYVTGPPGDPSRVFVVEEAGRIRLVKDGVTQGTPFLDINGAVLDQGEGGCECGMFSMAFAPDYATSGLFYVYFTRAVSPTEHELVVEEFKRSANPEIADPASGRVLVAIPHPGPDNHNGGQLQFGPDKQLYMATGDGGTGGDNAQDPGNLLGKMLVVNRSTGGASIYASGLRNPYRFSFDRSTGDLTIGDVGEGAYEEVDFRPEGTGAGANYGWNCFEGPGPGPGSCSVAGAVAPVLFYAHSGAAAINGGFVIRDSALPTWQGRYIYADTFNSLGGALRSAVLSNGASSGDAPTGLTASTVVSFGQDACGHIYVASINGPVYRIQPTSGPFPCKTAPVLKLDASWARKAAKLGAIVARVSCDEDCDLNATGVITVGKPKKGKHAAASRKRRKKGTRVVARAASVRLQLGTTQTVALDLSRKQTKRLRGLLARGKKLVARVDASATGGGGGTDTESATVKLRKSKSRR